MYERFLDMTTIKHGVQMGKGKKRKLKLGLNLKRTDNPEHYKESEEDE